MSSPTNQRWVKLLKVMIGWQVYAENIDDS